MRKIAILVIVCTLLINCSKSDTDECDKEVDGLTTTLNQKLSQYQENQTSENCTELKTALLTLKSKMNACGKSTAILDANTQNMPEFNCGNNTGTLTFWTKNSSYLTITVNCNGQTKSITSTYNLSPSCEANGCAIFTSLPYGQYNVSVRTSTGGTSSLNVAVNAPCYKYQIQ